MAAISLDDLIKNYPQITPEQVTLFNWFYSQFNNRSAANKRIVNIEPFYYNGVTGGSEFTVYAATKLYLCFNFIASATPANVPNATPNGITIYNESNTIMDYIYNLTALWRTDTLAISYGHLPAQRKDFYFSRIATGQYSYMTFNGFRITLV